ncbi:MAG: aminotransferase class V-fold PLP-dependent enzyme [Polyangiaceae bacterium]
MRAKIPGRGIDKQELLDTMRGYRAGDADWKAGRTWSLVYFAGPEHHELLREAHALFFAENALNPMAFKSLKRMEAEIVQMAASLLNGPASAVGTVTSGGTESILMAVKAARDRARQRRPWIRQPQIVAPRSIHVAFEKAAHYFGLDIRYADLGPEMRADVSALERLVTRNTVLIAASAPQYPHGVIDPIAEIGALAQRKKIPFHVDACVGGFLLPWIERLGRPLPQFDFRIPGVTSMSADLHKYGFAAKGASVLVYRDMSYLRHQFFVATEFPGGVYASPSMPGTRPGGPIAAAWAALMALGEEGYLEHTRRALTATDALRTGLEAIPELKLVAPPDATLVAWATRDPSVNLYAIADRLDDAGWTTDRQHKPASIHCTVTSNHSGVIDAYLADVRAAVDYVKSHPEAVARGNAPMYGMMAKIPFRGMVRQGVMKVMEQMYGPEGSADLDSATRSGWLGKVMDKYGGTLDRLLDRLPSARRER